MSMSHQFVFQGLEENSHLHRINTSTTYISTRRKNQTSAKPLQKTEVRYHFPIKGVVHVFGNLMSVDIWPQCLMRSVT